MASYDVAGKEAAGDSGVAGKEAVVKEVAGSKQRRRAMSARPYTAVVGGWVKTGRVADKGAMCFLEVNDGSGPVSLQCIVNSSVHRCVATDSLFGCARAGCPWSHQACATYTSKMITITLHL